MLRSVGKAFHEVGDRIRSGDSGMLLASCSPSWRVAAKSIVLPSALCTTRSNVGVAGGQSAAKHYVYGFRGHPGRTLFPSTAWYKCSRSQASRGWEFNSRRRTFSTVSPENVVYSIMLANFGVFMAWQQPGMRPLMSRHFMTSFTHMKAGYIHTLITHAFSHQQPLHLFSNMFTFYFFGSSLGGIIGSVRLVQLYAASAITGGIAQSFFDRRSVGLGASAAVNSIVIFSVLLNPTATYLLYGIVPVPAWALGIGWLAYDSMGAYKGGGNVAYMAHLGGAAVGIAGFAALTAGLW